MANNSSTSLIIYASVFCIVAMLLGAHGAPAPQPGGELDADEREAAAMLYAMKLAGLDTGVGAGWRFDKTKRNNAELINGLLGMNLSQLDLAGKK